MKILLKCADLVSHAVLILFMTVVILSAAASSLLRYYLPQAEQYRQVILEQINARSRHVIIDAEKIQSQWEPFRPSISLYGVSVKTRDMDRTINLEKLQLEINIIESVLRGEIYFDYIEIDNLDVMLLQAEDGSWSFSGSLDDNPNQEFNVNKTIDRLWAIDKLAVHRMQLALKPYHKEVIRLPNLKISSVTTYGKKNIFAELIDGNRQVSQLVLHTSGMPKAEDFSAQAYLKTEDFRLQNLLAVFDTNYRIADGTISNELWLDINNRHVDVRGAVSIRDLDIRKDDRSWFFQKIEGSAGAQYQDGEISVSVPRLQLGMQDRKLDIGRLHIGVKDIVEVQIAEIDLAALSDFLHGSWTSAYPQELLAALAPVGKLTNIHWRQQGEKEFVMQALLHDVSVQAWGSAPQLTGVNGFLEITQNDGYVQLDAPQLAVGFPKLFREPMQFNNSRGRVGWKVSDDKITVTGERLDLHGEFGRASAEFQLELPREASELEPPRLNLVVGLADSHVRYRHVFLPYILEENLLAWLDKNIHDGEVTHAGFIFHGPTTASTLEKKVVQLWLDVRGGRLTYLEGWPDIANVQGEFLLDDGVSVANIPAATTGAVAVNSVVVNLLPLNGTHSVDVSGRFAAPTADILEFIQMKPISDHMGHVLDGWRSPRGTAQGDIYVSSVLGKTSARPVVRINAGFHAMDLVMPKQDIKVTDINGNIYFSLLKGLESERLTGMFLGSPLSAAIKAVEGRKAPHTSIQLAGELDAAALAGWMGQPVMEFLQGKAPFTGEIYYGGDAAGLKVNSLLEGVAVNLPRPFNKSSKDKTALFLHLPFSGKSRQLDITYGQEIDIHFLIGKDGFQAGKIDLGGVDADYQDHKIVVTGKMLHADIKEWLGVIAGFQEFSKKYPEKKSGDWTLLVDNLKIRRLTGYGQSLESVNLDLFNTVTYWQLGIDQQYLKATLQVFDDGHPMLAHIHQVDMEFLSSKKKESGLSFSDQSLGDFPAVDFVIDRMIWNSEDYGEWEFKLRSYGDHLALEDIQSSVKGLRIGPLDKAPAALTWTLGSKPQTNFVGRVAAAGDLADALAAWGYQREVHSEQAWFDVEASWPGVPMDYDFGSVQAQTRFRLHKGNFADVSSTSTQALKFIGVFNVASLLSRLKLDFSDLTNQGLSYDVVSGNVSLASGVFTFAEPIHIQSPSSYIRLKGSVDMLLEKIDMRMGVTLPLASNLPWVVALAAGLPTAAGMYVVSKLLKKQVDQLSSTVYSVTGNLQDPDIKFERFFDNEMKQEKNLFMEETVIE